MSFSSSTSTQLSTQPNVTPLIDVLLVLLIIFMVVVPSSSEGLQTLVASPGATVKGVTPIPDPPLIVEVQAVTGHPEQALYRLRGHLLDPASLHRLLMREPERGELFVRGQAELDYQAIVVAVSAAEEAGFTKIGLLRPELRR